MTTAIGIIGCGNISNAYLDFLAGHPLVRIVAVADLDVARAQAKATEKNIPRGCSVSDLLATPEIALVINLTVPQAHASVDRQIIAAGKHAYSEKPFALDRAEGLAVVRAATAAGLRVGCAPDTVMGTGTQTARRMLDDGAIGRPLGFNAFMLCGGHESWHPAPEFYYLKGGGPMFDMGPYYLHALITALGPVKRVTGSATITRAQRTITSAPKNGTVMQVEVPTHVIGVLEFANGVTGTLTTSFDVRAHQCPIIEIYGTDGTLSLPDPNGFDGEVRLHQAGAKENWAVVAPIHRYAGGRGLGVVDMVQAIAERREHRANGDLAFHALDIMQAIHETAATGTRVDLSTTCNRPAAMPAEGLIAAAKA